MKTKREQFENNYYARTAILSVTNEAKVYLLHVPHLSKITQTDAQ